MSNYASAPTAPARPQPFFENVVDRLRNTIDRLDAAASRTAMLADKFIGPEPPTPPNKESILPAPVSVVAHQDFALEEISRRINRLSSQIERLEALV